MTVARLNMCHYHQFPEGLWRENPKFWPMVEFTDIYKYLGNTSGKGLLSQIMSLLISLLFSLSSSITAIELMFHLTKENRFLFNKRRMIHAHDRFIVDIMVDNFGWKTARSDYLYHN